MVIVKDLQVINRLKPSLEYQCILLIPMLHCNADLTKILIVYFESFPKKTVLAKVTLDKLKESILLIDNRPKKYLELKTLFDTLKHDVIKSI